MKIFSWNVNGIRAVEKKGLLAEFFAQKNPDIVCFQEIKIDASQISKERFEEKYPEYFKFYSHAERKGYAGTAIWSKIKPQIVLKNFTKNLREKYQLTDQFGDASTEGRICAAFFGDFWLLTVYTPNTKNDLSRLALREKWDAAFLDFAKGLEKGEFSKNDFEESEIFENQPAFEKANFAQAPVFFCGDLNVAHQEIDLANPKANRGKHGFTDEERAGFSKFLAFEFEDIFRNQHPNQPELYTWWSHFAKSRERNVGWRIDYFLLSKNAQNAKIEAKIHPEIMGSDHCPVSIEWSENV
ncbi:MAG: exodeoxyribonuclease III [bacterium]|nr:exodeoxyribonuclease III [bacterium]